MRYEYAESETDELKLLKYFFQDDIDSNSADTAYCDRFLALWDQVNTESFDTYQERFGRNFFDRKNYKKASIQGWTRLQTMFKLLPGSANPRWADFAGMDKRLNLWKGM